MIRGLDAKSVASIARSLRRISPEAWNLMRARMLDVGQVVADDAKMRAQSFPRKSGGTDRIANSIKVRSARGNVRVVAGGRGAPEAVALEHGGKPGTFRHPVWGHRDRWVAQEAHPFLLPAFETKKEWALDELERVYMDAAIRAFDRRF